VRASSRTLALTATADFRHRELSALCLVWGLLQALDAVAVPRDALEGMLEALTLVDQDGGTHGPG
jgi:hypothetical protein